MTGGQQLFRLGDVLERDIEGCGEDGQPILLLAAGQTIETVRQLRQLQAAGYAVDLPEARPARPDSRPAAEAAGTPAERAQHEFEAKLAAAAQIRSRATRAVGELLQRFRVGNRPKTAELLDYSAALVSEVAAAPFALAAVAHLSACSDYLVEHSVDVAVLLAGMGTLQGLPPDDLARLALAGLMHDIGLQLIPPGILKQTGPLTAEEFQTMKKHPRYGHAILQSCAGCPREVALVALQHHERMDGSGYPTGCTGEKLHPYSRLAAVAYVFDARTSDRRHAPAVSAWDALSAFHTNQRQAFDQPAVFALTKLVGVFPVGTQVKLDSGQAGVVAAPNPEDGATPIVRVNRDRHGIPLAYSYTLDLRESEDRIATAWT